MVHSFEHVADANTSESRGETSPPRRTFVFGDIHGCLAAFDHILEFVSPDAQDLVITLGDHVDRGPDSRGVIERLLELPARTQLIALRGNHEVMMTCAAELPEYFREWLRVGGREALRSYAPADRPGQIEDVPATHWQFMEESCRRWHETETHIFAHAGVNPHLPMAEQDDYCLYWKKLDPADCEPHASGKIVVCGHTPQMNGLPLDLGHTICLDTGVYRTGWLTCLDLSSGEVVQANQDGEIRHAGL